MVGGMLRDCDSGTSESAFFKKNRICKKCVSDPRICARINFSGNAPGHLLSAMQDTTRDVCFMLICACWSSEGRMMCQGETGCILCALFALHFRVTKCNEPQPAIDIYCGWYVHTNMRILDSCVVPTNVNNTHTYVCKQQVSTILSYCKDFHWK